MKLIIILLICIGVSMLFVFLVHELAAQFRTLRDQIQTANNKLQESERNCNELLVKLNSSERKIHVAQLELSRNTAKFERELAQARKDAVKKSRAVMRGQATEHLAPLMATEWTHKDFRFIGNPIDYVICSGSSAIADGQADHIDEVVLLDIKTGSSALTKVQRRIRDAIKEGRIKFAVYNTDNKELKEWTNANI